ncbi:MAG TPA: class I SAM-dependent methyltransferase [Alphaproteobacteria bacterium]|nr:class I SAM-dependent methyltransferase [Alphaproteobacteria bacterium]
MYTDVVDLREFYESSLGQVARRMLRRRVRLLWPDVTGQVVLGIGYPTPLLRALRDDADRVLAVMPARQGVTRWPPDGLGLTTLAEETELPFPDVSVDRIILMHGLEATENLPGLMRECWRVLAGGGRLLAIVPNRRGIWARTDRTPFGHGRPYSASQLSRMLREHLFVPERAARALYIPPLRARFLLGAAPAWEQIGSRWFEAFSGVVMIEASKQLYQTSGVKRKRRHRPVLIPVGQAQPARRLLSIGG